MPFIDMNIERNDADFVALNLCMYIMFIVCHIFFCALSSGNTELLIHSVVDCVLAYAYFKRDCFYQARTHYMYGIQQKHTHKLIEFEALTHPSKSVEDFVFISFLCRVMVQSTEQH